MSQVPSKEMVADWLYQVTGKRLNVLAVIPGGKVTCACEAQGCKGRAYFGINEIIAATLNPRLKLGHRTVCGGCDLS